PVEQLDDYPLAAEPDLPLEEKELAAVALAVFLKLTPKQRSCVILKDVLGYSLAEISELLNATAPEIKAALHRGRTRLRELAESVEVDALPSLDEYERELLARYVDRFNARDFEAVQAMLADEVRLDLIGRAKMRGIAEVSHNYFYNYKHLDDWHFGLGLVEGRSAILAYDPHDLSPQPAYFLLITWDGSQVSFIRDYRYARYVIQDAKIIVV
ncbi:MAG TPA: sigma factor-like helix-turn-helix DNA-binding protein, partial [Anaerolineae bacterium]|nr:sigma factor-like helix-turn-helix DNA-binding protein [Anaerolineae bacterium]